MSLSANTSNPRQLGFAKAVSARRMVRSFTNDPVDDDLLRLLLSQSLAGPSAGNTQSLELLVLTGPSVKEYWGTTLSGETTGNFAWPSLLGAPVLVLFYVDPSRYVARYSEPDKIHSGLGGSLSDWPVPYWWVDGGAAVQTLLLAASAAGLGACLFGQFEHEAAARNKFQVPERFRAVGTVALGHPDPDGDRPSLSAKRGRRPFADVVHTGRW